MSLLNRLFKAQPPSTEATVMPVTSLQEKKKAVERLAEQRVQLIRIDAEVDAYRAAIKAHRLRRRAGDRK